MINKPGSLALPGTEGAVNQIKDPTRPIYPGMLGKMETRPIKPPRIHKRAFTHLRPAAGAPAFNR